MIFMGVGFTVVVIAAYVLSRAIAEVRSDAIEAEYEDGVPRISVHLPTPRQENRSLLFGAAALTLAALGGGLITKGILGG